MQANGQASYVAFLLANEQRGCPRAASVVTVIETQQKPPKKARVLSHVPNNKHQSRGVPKGSERGRTWCRGRDGEGAQEGAATIHRLHHQLHVTLHRHLTREGNGLLRKGLRLRAGAGVLLVFLISYTFLFCFFSIIYGGQAQWCTVRLHTHTHNERNGYRRY